VRDALGPHRWDGSDRSPSRHDRGARRSASRRLGGGRTRRVAQRGFERALPIDRELGDARWRKGLGTRLGTRLEHQCRRARWDRGLKTLKPPDSRRFEDGETRTRTGDTTIFRGAESYVLDKRPDLDCFDMRQKRVSLDVGVLDTPRTVIAFFGHKPKRLVTRLR
jgi:hypothetical protein